MLGEEIKQVYLKANSPRNAFYILSIKKISDGFLVYKKSGANGHVLHEEAWFRTTLEEAEKLFQRKIKNKIDPKRKSSRKYQIVIENRH